MKNNENQSVRQQIAGHFRTAILAGELPPGSKLESTRKLAERFGTSAGNVHKALSLLVAEGLISRRTSFGTTVNARKNELKTVAFCSSEEAYYSSGFIRELVESVRREFDRIGIECRLELCRGAIADPGVLKKLGHAGKIQGFIASGLNPREYQSIQSLQLPFALLTGGRYRSRVYLSDQQLLDLIFEALDRTGCQKIAIIAGLPGPPFSESELKNGNDAFFRGFLDRVRARGWTSRPEWQSFREQTCKINTPLRNDFDSFAAAMRIFSAPERPDALVVYPDTRTYGMLLALEKLRIHVPEDLQLVLYRNREVPQLCPMPAQWVEAAVQEIAAALAAQLMHSFRGEPDEPIRVEYHLGTPGF